jgi:hypothetical protein
MNRSTQVLRLFGYISILSVFPLTACARVSQAVPPTIEFRAEAIKDTMVPYGPNGRGQTGSRLSTSFVELQLNLCNSGLASCYTNGQAIPEGAEKIYETGPNIVTVNEICSNDVATLQSSLAEAWPADYTYSVFMPAIDKRTSAAFKCKNGNPYGDVVLGRVAASTWTTVDAYGGRYTAQDGTNEHRTFACAAAKDDHFACTTHLTASSKPVALSQCKALMFDAIPYLKSLSGSTTKSIVGADLNLYYNTSDPEDVSKCVPSGWTRKGDGKVQHVIHTNDLKFSGSKGYPLRYTDHDGWLVKLLTG